MPWLVELLLQFCDTPKRRRRRKISITMLRWLNWVICLKGFFLNEIHTRLMLIEIFSFLLLLWLQIEVLMGDLRCLRRLLLSFLFPSLFSAHKMPLKCCERNLHHRELHNLHFCFRASFLCFHLLDPPLRQSVATHKSSEFFSLLFT